MSRELDGGQKGQALVIAALAMVVLVGFLALAIDGGHAYAQRRRMQNAADAGALAGARALALEENAEAAATEYAVDRYGADSMEVTIDDDGGQTVTVVTHKSFPTFSASIVGWPVLCVSARASASYGVVGRMTGLFPLAVKEFGFQMGQTYTIWDDDKTEEDPLSGVIVGGNLGWLNYDGAEVSNDELKQWVREGYDGFISVGDWVNGDPGTRSSALQEALSRIGDVVFIPVYNEVRSGENGSGQLDYHVVAFAAFKIADVHWSGSPKKLLGVFQYAVVAGQPGGPVDKGVAAVTLTD